jgi:hypothetical protein
VDPADFVTCLQGLIQFDSVLLFPEKEAKSVGPLRGMSQTAETSAKPTQEPISHVVLFFFQKKKQKALFRFAEDQGLPKPQWNRPWGV